MPAQPALCLIERRFQSMSQIITVSDEGAALLKQQASARGLSDAWVEMLANESAQAARLSSDCHKARAAAACILEIQKRLKSDPEGWTIRDYIGHGRR